MKAEQFRVGNLIDRSGLICKVVEIHAGGILTEPLDVTAADNNHDLTLALIPLTEDWLVRLGFKKTHYIERLYGQEYFFNGVIIYLKYGVFRYYTAKTNRAWIELESVNELQNLYFALTGEELKTK